MMKLLLTSLFLIGFFGIGQSDLLEYDIEGVDPNDLHSYQVNYWPGGVIPFDTKDLEFANAISMMEAIGELMTKTCLKFVPIKNKRQDKIIFTQGNKCSSFIGRQGGSQRVWLGPDCADKGTVLHQIMHALGFWHENSRTDRGSHVKVIWDNIDLPHRKHFQNYSDPSRDHEDEPYDINSILHTPLTMFARDSSEPTLISRDEAPEQITLKVNKKLSAGDIRKIKKRYCQGWLESDEYDQSDSSANKKIKITDRMLNDGTPESSTNATKKKSKEESDENNSNEENRRREREREQRLERERQTAEENTRAKPKKNTKKKGKNKRHLDESISRNQNARQTGKDNSEITLSTSHSQESPDYQMDGDQSEILVRVHRSANDRDRKARKDRNKERRDRERQKKKHGVHEHEHTHHAHHKASNERSESILN